MTSDFTPQRPSCQMRGMARAIGFADTPCASAYAQSAYGLWPPAYLQTQIRRRRIFRVSIQCSQGICGYDQCKEEFANCNETTKKGCDTPLGTTENCSTCGHRCPEGGCEKKEENGVKKHCCCWSGAIYSTMCSYHCPETSKKASSCLCK